MHRDHIRHMLESPLRGLNHVSEAPYSPAFKLFDDNASTFAENNGWTDFQDPGDDFIASFVHLDDGSPTKRSGRRSRMDRCHSTSALPDMMTSNFTNKLTNNLPTLRLWEDDTADPAPSPTRAPQSAVQLGLLQSPVPLPQNATTMMDNLAAQQDWPALEGIYFDQSGFPAEDLTGLDILQGFEKIGSGARPDGNGGGQKPALSRHFSTNF